MYISKKRLALLFREYWNDYLTVGVFAVAYGVTKEQMLRAINLGRIIHNRTADKLAEGK